jgi:hypothetical protein
MPMISSSSSLSLLSPLCYQMPPLRFSWRSIKLSLLLSFYHLSIYSLTCDDSTSGFPSLLWWYFSFIYFVINVIIAANYCLSLMRLLISSVSRLELAGQFGNPLIQDLIRADSGLELAGPPSPLLSSFPFSSSCSLLSCFVASFYSMVDVFLATRMNNVWACLTIQNKLEM